MSPRHRWIGREVMRELTHARTAVQEATGPKAEADDQLREALGHLFAVAEDYPELQPSDQFLQLQDRVSSLEERIAERREFYNESATIFNATIRQIPDVLFRWTLGLEPRELFRSSKEQMEDVDIGSRLESVGWPRRFRRAASSLPGHGEDGAPLDRSIPWRLDPTSCASGGVSRSDDPVYRKDTGVETLTIVPSGAPRCPDPPVCFRSSSFFSSRWPAARPR